MTLYRQLLLFTLVLFFTLFTATWLVKLLSTRTFLEDQLESHAQDTATSLGLSISPHLAENDLAAVEAMVDAVFDRGYYRSILLRDLDDKPVLEKTQDVTINDIPAWFIRLIPLRTPRAGTLITAGWNQLGRLYVESHPGYAYKTLWDATVSMTGIFGLTAIVVLGLGAFGLRLLLIPLRQVERQAEDLCSKQYTFQEKLPRTRELRRVVMAMNSMTGKVKQMFDEQALVAETLRGSAYSDALTGLGNRRYFEGQVAAGMAGGNGAEVKGACLLVQVANLQAMNQEKGYEFSDRLLRRVGEAIRESVHELVKFAISRISGGSFAVFLPEATAEDASRTAGKITAEFARLAAENLGPEIVGHVGGAIYHQAASLGQLLSVADQAMSAAAGKGPNAWAIAPVSHKPLDLPQGEQEWRQFLDQVLSGSAIDIVGQSAVELRSPRRILHQEIFARITTATGRVLSAGLFLPLAERLRRVSAIDRIVLEKALQLDGGDLAADELAVNISPRSLHDAAFIAWLLAALQARPRTAGKIAFEFAEFAAVQELTKVRDFTREVQALGHAVGLDHVGQSFANFGYLKSLQPKYIKIDRAFTNELKGGDSDSHFFIGALTGVAHSLDILVIAEGVEEAEHCRALGDLNIDGIQGYYIDRPSVLKS